VTLRCAVSTDARILAPLIRAFRDHLGAGTPTDAELHEHLPRALDDPSIEFGGAWLGESAVGYTQLRLLRSVWAPGNEAHLEDLFVVAEARGQAVGRALLRHAMERAAARGACRFSLNTNEGNAVAQALYRSEGLSPQSHALYPGGREILWVKALP
jgi:ribosomal protein S18 acetylase RimI-like enzyme